MPVKIRKKGKCYEVRTPNRVHSKCTSKEKAHAQRRIIEAADRKKSKRGGRR